MNRRAFWTHPRDCSSFHSHHGIDAVIVGLNVSDMAVEKIEAGDLTTPNCAGQLGGGFKKEGVDLLGSSGSGIGLTAASQNTHQNNDRT
jgi:hypothetical protein